MCFLVCILKTNSGVTSESGRHGLRLQHQWVRSVRGDCCMPEPSAGVSPQEDYQGNCDRRGLEVLLWTSATKQAQTSSPGKQLLWALLALSYIVYKALETKKQFSILPCQWPRVSISELRSRQGHVQPEPNLLKKVPFGEDGGLPP
jgi:hypothetical protein